MVDIHYELRASVRGMYVSLEDIISNGSPVEKRSRFANFDMENKRAFLFGNFVHILSSDLKKRITVMPYSKRKWKFVVK
jgi:hypothetical protein